MPMPIPSFDGHNDVLLQLYLAKDGNPVKDFLEGKAALHIDLPKARAGQFIGGLFALYSPNPEPLDFFKDMKGESYALPLVRSLELDEARKSIIPMVANLYRILDAAKGAVVLCTSVAELRAAKERGALSVVLHLEGADCIDENFDFLEILYAAGLRSLGPVWSRNTIFGHGVPFHFPAGPDCGPGLTPAGERLVRFCNEKKILIDLSHITEKGFWDVARLSHAPLVATHSNAHALCPTPRNLTDRQLEAIRDTKGLVGLNFATCFLREDGQMRPDTSLDLMVRQLDYLIEKAGEDHVGLGSDFDGAVIPETIGSCAGLQALYEPLRAKGYSEALLHKLGYQNWFSLLERTIG